MVIPSGSPEQSSKVLTGLFFGSFNPVHQGHLILAEYFASLPTMNEVWFVLSPQNPLKIGDSMLDFETRAEWIETCIQDNPRLKLCTVEKDFPLPSYTFRTLDHLDKQFRVWATRHPKPAEKPANGHENLRNSGPSTKSFGPILCS